MDPCLQQEPAELQDFLEEPLWADISCLAEGWVALRFALESLRAYSSSSCTQNAETCWLFAPVDGSDVTPLSVRRLDQTGTLVLGRFWTQTARCGTAEYHDHAL